MKKIFAIILLALLFAAPALKAQKNLLSVQYSVGFPTGDFSKYISNTSFLGMNVDYRNMVTPNIGVGVEFAWNNFYESSGYNTFTTGTASISGKQYRYTFAAPLLLAADYYFKSSDKIKPFIGIGLGTTHSRNSLDMGMYRWEEDVWHFALRPEAGLIYTLNYNVGLIVTGKYYSNSASGDVSARNFMTVNVGLAWTY
jgi:outer membrane protein